jgi:molybdopterin-guanine dinucleotide biosynthesis protein A
MITTPCVIFAGGKSSRMGEDKALLPFASFSTLTEYQYSRLSKIFTSVYISCKESSLFPFEANFLEDIHSDIYAPTIGFHTAFEKLQSDSIFVLSVDAPFVDESIIQSVFEQDKASYDATIAKTSQGIQPLCGIYHRSLEKEFQTMLKTDNHKLGLMLKNANTHYCSFEGTQAFLNMNHPQDYQKALLLINN